MIFSPDVEQVLRESAQNPSAVTCFKCNLPPKDHYGVEGHLYAADTRPTRQQIIEEAVRNWALRQARVQGGPFDYIKEEAAPEHWVRDCACSARTRSTSDICTSALLRGDGVSK